MLKRIWLLFSQAVVVILAFLFVTKLFFHQTHFTDWNAHLQPLNTYSLADAASKAMPAVVNVFSNKNNPSAQIHTLTNHSKQNHNRFFADDNIHLGSGVIVSADGYLITNQHVIANAEEIEVALNDGRTAEAKVIGNDPETDLSVLKINLKNLPFVQFANSNQVRIGDLVLAIGNPFGVGQTATMGIVSALGRNHLGINTFENYIQTDAAINPGNSGGALVNEKGQLIGINTAIYSRSGGSLGIGFAIPSSSAQAILQNIIKTGTVTRGWVGLKLKGIPFDEEETLNAQAEYEHPIVVKVIAKGPAQKAGIKSGDQILSVNQTTVYDPIILLNLIAELQPGTRAKMVIQRGEIQKNISILIEQRPAKIR